jgi:hypothetical protein
MWMRSGARAPAATAPAPPAAGLAPIAGGSPEVDDELPEAGAAASSPEGWPGVAESAPQPEVVFVAALFGAASVFFGIFPSPLFNFAAHAGHALTGIF